ncbi:STAS/SEC14 domain-containing protein [Marinomonas ostreistagni]|uniref:STAS/SEC14 domain-containing protein n=1 Tax=Marinomonas ostreistagni TaxID=359209 RepID=UPI00194FEDD2|nr:STAS/SEC14 domain-containing protein [Marinomonas ostreistagni]MBM6552072.1 STAS/SEC14 domain-containing protein [Marinomonas ostreistagni]
MKTELSHPVIDSGIELNVERHQQTLLLRFKPSGKLTPADYLSIEPRLVAALYSINTPKVRALVDLSDLGQIDVRSAWEDIIWMHKHSSEFERIALYNPRPWHHLIARVGNWFMQGEIKTFDQFQDALQWSHAH